MVPGFDEVAEFQATVKAMQIMGINNEDINGMILNNFNWLREYDSRIKLMSLL